LHPLCAAYEREVRSEVTAALDRGVRSMSGLLEGLPRVQYVGGEELRRFSDPELLLMNVNSPGDLARARAVLREGRPHGG
jgi:molybdopterin-guanine dinucleotide biosynthesis protein A